MRTRSAPEKWPPVIGTSLPMFESTVILCRSERQWNAAVSFLHGLPLDKIDPKRLVGKHSLCGCQTQYGKSDRKETIFMVGVFDGRKRTLLHELAHAVFDICGYYGIPSDAGEPNEFYCYMIEYLYSELEKYCKK